MFKYKIPIRLPTLNEYTAACRANKYAGHSLKQKTEQDIMWFLSGKVIRPVWAHFVWLEPNRRRDKDNVAFAKKFVLDALVKKGVLPNDSNKWILGFTDDFVYGEGEGVIVRLEVGK